MNQQHYLLKGTFLLTLTGLLTRTAGFFYKIFLSRTIGAKEIGLFQITIPVIMFCMAVSAGGIQTAISRFTAEYSAEKDSRSAQRILFSGLLISGFLSIACAVLLYLGSAWIARSFLLEPRCAPLLRMLAVSIPFSVIHTCLNGYFIGRKNITVSAASQLLEQLLRIGSVFFFYIIFTKNGRTMDAAIMVLGQIAGELSAALYCIYCFVFSKTENQHGRSLPHTSDFKKTISVSLPLGLNRMLTCVLQGIEAALLPQQLQLFGFNSSEALAVYGTLTGMALPLIMFPTAVTGSLGMLLLPAVSEARALNQDKKIAGTANASFHGSLLLGFFFLTTFLLFGGETGELLFHSALAGNLIRKLAVICPFLYINTTLISILHGLGKTTVITIWNVIGFVLRLAAILVLVPQAGIDGYLAGTLFSQAMMTIVCLVTLHRCSGFSSGLTESLIKPGILCILSGIPVCTLQMFGPEFIRQSPGGLFLAFIFYIILFGMLTFFLILKKEERSAVCRLLLPLLPKKI